MGLDMNLIKKTYVKNWEHTKPEERHEITVTKGGKTCGIKTERISEITEDIMYWRKANHIHHWFVDNVQGGEDNCQDYYVSREQLTELLALCHKVAKDHKLAPELLPTQAGFFFGPTEYDDEYFKDIDNTIEVLETLASEGGDDRGHFYYSSSW